LEQSKLLRIIATAQSLIPLSAKFPSKFRIESHHTKQPTTTIPHLQPLPDATMGLFSRKDKTASSTSGSIRKYSASLADTQSISSQSSLRSPGLPRQSYTSIPPLPVPKIDLPKAPDPHVDPAGYLRSIGAVRERCEIVLEKAKRNELNHFEVDMSKFEDTTSFVVSIIKVYLQSVSVWKLI